MLRHTLILICLIACVIAKEGLNCQCGKKPINSRIRGGRESIQHHHPWMATVLQVTENFSFLCGGSLINDRYVLTAAHCYLKGGRQQISDYRIFLGHHYLPSLEAPFLEAKRIIIPAQNREIKDTLSDDIMLIELTDPVEFSDEISPICLPEKDTNGFGSLLAIGFGLTENGERSSSLQEFEFEEMTTEECLESARTFHRGRISRLIGTQLDLDDFIETLLPSISKNQICLKIDDGATVCEGDSGGPVIAYSNGLNYVAGVTSFGMQKCSAYEQIYDAPIIFTRVSSYLDWIGENTNNANWCGKDATKWQFATSKPLITKSEITTQTFQSTTGDNPKLTNKSAYENPSGVAIALIALGIVILISIIGGVVFVNCHRLHNVHAVKIT